MVECVDQQQQQKQALEKYLCPLDHNAWIWVNEKHLQNYYRNITCLECSGTCYNALLCKECNFTICQNCRPSKHEQFCPNPNWIISYTSPKNQASIYCNKCSTSTKAYKYCTNCHMYVCFKCQVYSHQTFCQQPKFAFQNNPQGQKNYCSLCGSLGNANLFCQKCKFIACVSCRKSKQWK